MFEISGQLKRFIETNIEYIDKEDISGLLTEAIIKLNVSDFTKLIHILHSINIDITSDVAKELGYDHVFMDYTNAGKEKFPATAKKDFNQLDISIPEVPEYLYRNKTLEQVCQLLSRNLDIPFVDIKNHQQLVTNISVRRTIDSWGVSLDLLVNGHDAIGLLDFFDYHIIPTLGYMLNIDVLQKTIDQIIADIVDVLSNNDDS